MFISERKWFSETFSNYSNLVFQSKFLLPNILFWGKCFRLSSVKTANNHSVPIPLNETERLLALHSYQILDTASEEKFDSLTQIAAYICNSSMALISLVDTNRLWFKSKLGIKESENARNTSFCQYAIMQDDLLEIENALENEIFKNQPSVLGPPYIRFYVGTPLKTPDGFNIGTLCVFDSQPNRLNPQQKTILKALSNQIIYNFELNKKT